MKNLLYVSLFTILIFMTINPIYASPTDGDEIEVEGLIQAIGSDSLENDSIMVNNFVFYVDSDTDIETEHGGSLSFSDLQVDDFVEVEADILPNGKYLAKKVELKDDSQFSEFEVEGYIDSLGNDFVYVGGHEFSVTAQTMIHGEHGVLLSFSDLALGIYVEIKALIQPDGSFWAKKIKVEDEHNHDFEFSGTIDSLGTNTISVHGFTAAIDSNTVIKGHDHQVLTFADLSVGMRVEVKARLLTDGSLLATRIKVEDEYENEIEITGAIDTLYSNVIIVSGFEFWTDSNTVILDHHRNVITFNDLQKGMIVEIKGFTQNDGSVYASKVKIEDFWRHDIEFTGVIDSIGTNWLSVLGNLVFVDSSTVILDHSRNPVGIGDLSVGMRVEVKALVQNDGTLLASRIKIEDNNPNQVEVYGTIDSLTLSSVFVSGSEFLVDDQTVVLNHAHIIIPFSDLQVGMFVEVKAFSQTDGSFLTVKIRIEDSPSFYSSIGIISGISSQTIYISNSTYQINTSTVLINSQYHPITTNELLLGSEVTVWADLTNGSNSTALQVKLEPKGTLTVVGEGQTNSIPSTFKLGQNYPNPFNPVTTIPFLINGAASNVQLTVYNVLGQKVKTIFNGVLQEGNYQFSWNGTNNSGQQVPSGMYFYELIVGKSNRQVRGMMLIK